MFSAIFVDRPRLSVVIAIVTSIAGALALFTIPVAQYPDIVPPQVSVTTTYPGASAEVVESTVAQPIRVSGRGRRQDDLHEERQRQRRQLHAHRVLRARHRSGHQRRQRQQPGADRPGQSCPRTSASRASRSGRSPPRCWACWRSTRPNPCRTRSSSRTT
ncbi:efflux RND transporter permease subunit [Methylobacterium oryzae CBMB20]